MSVENVVNTAEEVLEDKKVPTQTFKMQELDKKTLELAKLNQQLAMEQAKTALAKSENADLTYKYIVLQIYLKYGLNENDAINENGDIIKNGALVQAQG